MRCTVCNAPLNEGSNICPICGFENDVNVPQNPIEKEAPAPAREDVPVPQNEPVTYEPAVIEPLEPPVQPEGLARREDKRAAKPKGRVKPIVIILPIVLVLLVAAALVYYYVLRPLNAPQTRMAAELAQFFGDVGTINGSMLDRLGDDHVAALTVDTGLELPALGEASVTVRRAKTGENGGLDLKVYAGETQVFAALLAHDDTELLISSRLGDKSSPAKMALPGSPGESVVSRLLGIQSLDVELPEDFLTKTGAVLFECFDAEWFDIAPAEKTTFGGEPLGLERVRLTMDAARVSEAAGRLRERLAGDAQYCAEVDELFGEGTAQSLMDGTDDLDDLVSALPDARFELSSLSLDGAGIGVEVAVYIPGVADVTAELFKLNSPDTTEYAFTFGGDITGMASGTADLRAFFTASGPDLTLDVKYVNRTETGDAVYEADERLTFLLDLSETAPGAYAGTLTQDGAALSAAVTIDFNDNATGVLTSMEALSPGAPTVSTLPELFAAFAEGLRLDELLPLLM